MFKTLTALLVIIFIVIIASIASYFGTGLPTQEDKISVRQASLQDPSGRSVRGGGTSFGK